MPGEWYGMGDIARMAGVEKAANPAFRRQLDPWEIRRGGEPEPLHLYRLTDTGLKVKEALPAE